MSAVKSASLVAQGTPTGASGDPVVVVVEDQWRRGLLEYRRRKVQRRRSARAMGKRQMTRSPKRSTRSVIGACGERKSESDRVQACEMQPHRYQRMDAAWGSGAVVETRGRRTRIQSSRWQAGQVTVGTKGPWWRFACARGT